MASAAAHAQPPKRALIDAWLAEQASLPAESALRQLAAIDCSAEAEKCRYFAVMENVAYARQCPLAGRAGAPANAAKTEEPPEDAIRSDYAAFAKAAIEQWREMAPPSFAHAVRADSPLQSLLDRQAASLLANERLGPSRWASACARVAAMDANATPALDMSGLIEASKNYKAFRDARQPSLAKRLEAERNISAARRARVDALPAERP